MPFYSLEPVPARVPLRNFQSHWLFVSVVVVVTGAGVVVCCVVVVSLWVALSVLQPVMDRRPAAATQARMIFVIIK